jgi:hypothetical protein
MDFSRNSLDRTSDQPKTQAPLSYGLRRPGSRQGQKLRILGYVGHRWLEFDFPDDPV